jgi:myo-inositol-1(or 4)-monophosphatase
MRVSQTGRADRATVHTGSDRSEDPSRAFRFFNRLAAAVQRPRILGSAALDICFVAAGRADAYFEHGIFVWDVAAAGLILERAGGVCEVLKDHGAFRMAVLASNGRLQAPLRAMLLPLIDPS